MAEVREASDLLRFYAAEAERIVEPVSLLGPTEETNEHQLWLRGVLLGISSWNFPLAIFIRQVAATLATGSAVIANHPKQTPASHLRRSSC